MPSWHRFTPLIVGAISVLGTVVGIVQMQAGGNDQGELGLTTVILTLGSGWVLMGYALLSDAQERTS